MLKNSGEREVTDLFEQLKLWFSEYNKDEPHLIIDDGMFLLYTKDVILSFDVKDKDINTVLIYSNCFVSPTEQLLMYAYLTDTFEKELFTIAEDFCYDEEGITVFGEDANFLMIEKHYVEYLQVLDQVQQSTIH